MSDRIDTDDIAAMLVMWARRMSDPATTVGAMTLFRPWVEETVAKPGVSPAVADELGPMLGLVDRILPSPGGDPSAARELGDRIGNVLELLRAEASQTLAQISAQLDRGGQVH